MADYKFNIDNQGIIRYSDRASIPQSATNKDYKEYLEYVAQGGETDPWMTDEELLEEAKINKEQEIKDAYIDEEENSTIEAGGNIYESNFDHLLKIDLEKRLAESNLETDIVVFDVDFNPHTVSVSAIEPVMQDIRIITKERQVKGKGLYRDIIAATTIEEVDLIMW